MDKATFNNRFASLIPAKNPAAFRSAAIRIGRSVGYAMAALCLLTCEPASAEATAQNRTGVNVAKQQGTHGVFVKGTVPDVVIVDGERQAVLVRPYFDDSELLKDAVNLLQRTLKDATGKTLKVLRDGEDVPEGTVKVHVGMTGRVRAVLGPRLKTMDADGYILLARPNEVLIGGASDFGLFFGVADFLHRFVGARWYLPGELGYVCPHHEKLVLTGVNCVESPDWWLNRSLCGLVGETRPGTAQDWLKANRYRQRLNFHHAYNMYCWERFGEYPDAWPLENGKRKKPGNYIVNWMPCFTSSNTVRICAEAAIEYFDRHPDQESCSLGFPDGGASCACEGCQKLGGSVGEKAYRLYNCIAEEVAKKYPHKLLGCLAYQQTAAPPSFRLHPMLLPMLTWMPNPLFPDGVAEFTGDEVNAKEPSGDGMATLKPGRKGVVFEWLQKANSIGFYDYYFGSDSYAPRILTRARAASLRLGNARGMSAYYAQPYPNWGLDGPKLYALSRLLWNVRENEDDLRGDFCRGMFGPAAEPMDRYFKRCEEQLYKSPSYAAAWDALPAFDGEVVERALNDFSEAEKLSGADKLIRRRIDFYRKAFEVTRLAYGNFEPVRELRRGEAIGKVLNDLAVLPDIRGPVADYLTNTYLSKGAPKDFEIAWQPQSLVGIDRSKWNNPYGYSRHLGRPDATIKERVVDMVQTKALAAAKGMPPEQFKARMREEARRQLAEGFAGIEVAEGSKLAQLRDEVEVSAARCVTAAKVQTGPAVADGLSGGYWAKAAREGDFKQYATHESVPTRTEFAACHDGKYLYIGIWCYQPRAETEAKKGYSGNEGNPWSDAGIELFINRTEPGSVRYQLAFNAAGGVVGISDATAMQSPWVCPDLTCGTQIGDDVWTLVARIPFASLGIDPAVDKTIRLQVVRNRPPLEGPQEISSWYPSSFSGHFISGRGLLILE